MCRLDSPAACYIEHGFAAVQFQIMLEAFKRAGVIAGLADVGLPDVECFVCERRISRAMARYDPEFDLWECHDCVEKWE